MEQLLEKIESMKVLEIKPDDVLVVTIPIRLSAESIKNIKGRLMQALGISEERKIIFVDSSVGVSVLRNC